MKRTIKIDLPELSSLMNALVPRVEPRYAAGVREAEAQLARARERLAAAGADIERLRPLVARGAAPVMALEDALRKAEAAHLVIEPAEVAVRDARAALDAATAAAHRRVVEQCIDERNDLQRAADQLAPALEELRTLELALDRLSRQAGGREVPALRWPPTAADDLTWSHAEAKTS